MSSFIIAFYAAILTCMQWQELKPCMSIFCWLLENAYLHSQGRHVPLAEKRNSYVRNWKRTLPVHGHTPVRFTGQFGYAKDCISGNTHSAVCISRVASE